MYTVVHKNAPYYFLKNGQKWTI